MPLHRNVTQRYMEKISGLPMIGSSSTSKCLRWRTRRCAASIPAPVGGDTRGSSSGGRSHSDGSRGSQHADSDGSAERDGPAGSRSAAGKNLKTAVQRLAFCPVHMIETRVDPAQSQAHLAANGSGPNRSAGPLGTDYWIRSTRSEGGRL